jgi:hypothetical protein
MRCAIVSILVISPVGSAIAGRIVDGKKRAAVGIGAAAGAGTAVVAGTRGEEVDLGGGAAITLRLPEPLTVRIRA